MTKREQRELQREVKLLWTRIKVLKEICRAASDEESLSALRDIEIQVNRVELRLHTDIYKRRAA